MSQGRGFVVGVDVAQLNLHRMESDDLDVTAIVWCGGWDLNPRTPTGQGPEPCAFDLAWQPPLGGGVRNFSDKAVCRRRIHGPGSSRVVIVALSPALPSLAVEGPSGAGGSFLEFLCIFLSVGVSSPSLASVYLSVAG